MFWLVCCIWCSFDRIGLVVVYCLCDRCSAVSCGFCGFDRCLLWLVGWLPVSGGGFGSFGGFGSCNLTWLVVGFCIWMLWVSAGL